MGKNVMIPLSLVARIIGLLDCWDTSKGSYELRYEYGSVLWELKVKLQRLALREAYARILHAEDEDARDLARIEYLRQKNRLGDVDVDVLF